MNQTSVQSVNLMPYNPIEIPDEVFDAAQLVSDWADKQNFKYWVIGGCCSRQYVKKCHVVEKLPNQLVVNGNTYTLSGDTNVS
jgi:hypothetical protein